jgi:uncharacterized membrane-anchored protein YjiN (DUF445 family)
VTAGGAHRPLLDVVLPYLRMSLVTNRELLKHQLKEYGEKYGLLGMLVATNRRTGKLIDKTVAFMAEIEADPRHEMRQVLDDWLRKVAHDLQHDPALAVQVDRMAQQVLADPATADWLTGVVGELLGSVREQLQDPEGVLTERLSGALVRVGTRAVEDPGFQRQLEEWVERSVLWAVEHYADEFTALVRHTIDRWDGAETARRVELMAGRDLQFIRINGTVVGGLAGVAIHAVALALGSP